MPKRSDRLLAAGALVVVLAVLAIGFRMLGPRESQRALTADGRRVEDLRAIARAISGRQKPLPATLAELPNAPLLSLNDPVTNVPYEYHPHGAAYELCATFATASRNEDFQRYPPFWNHAKGRQCFELNGDRMAVY